MEAEAFHLKALSTFSQLSPRYGYALLPPVCGSISRSNVFPQGFPKHRFRTSSVELTVLYLVGTSLAGWVYVCPTHQPLPGSQHLAQLCPAQGLPSHLAPNGAPGRAGELGLGRLSPGRSEHSGAAGEMECAGLGAAAAPPPPPAPRAAGWGSGSLPAPKHRCTASSVLEGFRLCQLVFDTRLSHEVIAS